MRKSYPSLIGFNDIVGEDYNGYGNVITVLAKIDRTLAEINGTNPDTKIIIDQHRPSYLYNSVPNDIRPYLEPVINSTMDIDNEMAKTVEKIWTDMIKNGTANKIITTISSDVDCSNEIQTIVSRYVISSFDLYRISGFVEKICKFNIIDHSLTNDLLLSARESTMEYLKYIDKRLNFLCNQLELEIKAEQEVGKYGFDNVMSTFKEFDFEKIYANPESVKLLQYMNDEFKIRGITVKNLQEEPEIAAILILEFGKGPGDDDSEFLPDETESSNVRWESIWTFHQMKRLYLEGWNRWVQMFFLNRGVGLSNAGFDRCVELGSDYGSLWLLNNSSNWPSKLYSKDDVLKISKDKIMTKLGKEISRRNKD